MTRKQARAAREKATRTLRTTVGARNSATDQQFINSTHDNIRDGITAMGKNPPPAALQYPERCA